MFRRSSHLSAKMAIPSKGRADLVMPHELMDKVLDTYRASPVFRHYFEWTVGPQVGMKYHFPLVVVCKSDGPAIRGVFVPGELRVPRGSPLFTVPYDAALTSDNIRARCPDLPINPWNDHKLTYIPKDELRKVISDKGMHPMLDTLVMAIPLAHLAHYFSKQDDTLRDELHALKQEMKASGYTKQLDVPDFLPLEKGIMPYLRMVDEEKFDERFLFNLYKGGLNGPETESYNKTLGQFSQCMTEVHTKLGLPYPLHMLTRYTRLILARTEQLPVNSHTGSSNQYVRWARRTIRKLRGLPPLPTVNTVVPMVDMLNHSKAPNVALHFGPSPLFQGKPCITCVALRDLRGGEELRRSYNFGIGKANSFFRYGFLPYDLMAVSKHDSFEGYQQGCEYFARHPDALAEEQRIADEVRRLEKMWQQGRDQTKKEAETEEPEAPRVYPKEEQRVSVAIDHKAPGSANPYTNRGWKF